MEVDERDLSLHRASQTGIIESQTGIIESQTGIIDMSRIRTTISVSEQTILAKRVIVRASFTLDDGHRRDADRNLAEPGLENPLLTHQRDALAFVNKPVHKQLPLKDAFVSHEALLLLEESERGQSNVGVRIVALHA